MSDTAKQLDALLQRMAEEKTLSPEALKKIGEVRERAEALEERIAELTSETKAKDDMIADLRADNERLMKEASGVAARVTEVERRAKELDDQENAIRQHAAKLDGQLEGSKFVRDFCMKLVSNSVLKRNVIDSVTGSHPVWQSYEGNGYVNHQSMSETHDITTTEEVE